MIHQKDAAVNKKVSFAFLQFVYINTCKYISISCQFCFAKVGQMPQIGFFRSFFSYFH